MIIRFSKVSNKEKILKAARVNKTKQKNIYTQKQK